MTNFIQVNVNKIYYIVLLKFIDEAGKVDNFCKDYNKGKELPKSGKVLNDFQVVNPARRKLFDFNIVIRSLT